MIAYNVTAIDGFEIDMPYLKPCQSRFLEVKIISNVKYHALGVMLLGLNCVKNQTAL